MDYGWVDSRWINWFWMDEYLENFVRFSPAELPIVEEERPQLGARLRQRLEESQCRFIPQWLGCASTSGCVSDFWRLFFQRQVQLRQSLEACCEEDEVGAAQRQLVAQFQAAVVQLQEGKPIRANLIQSNSILWINCSQSPILYRPSIWITLVWMI